MTALIDRVREIYGQIDEAVGTSPELAGRCLACGKCCSFESYGHRLYVTPPELLYLAHHIGSQNLKPVTDGLCPYNVQGKCTIYDYRFASCRIFCCNSDREFQNQLTESILAQLKKMCRDLVIPYKYMELTTALSGSRCYTQNAVRGTQNKPS
jgi:Fe-S-cluster containining protein